jgi:hypothetical protein
LLRSVTELAHVYLSGLGQPTRAVLDAACTLRRPTLSLLGALLPEVPPHDAYEMLGPLPFVEFGPDGLVVHDTVREVVAALLRVNDPPLTAPTGSRPGGNCGASCAPAPAAFQCLCEADSVPAWLLAADPVAASWREHLRANPVPRGQQVLFLRHVLAASPPHAAAEGGEATTPAHAALILGLKRRYLEMRPGSGASAPWPQIPPRRCPSSRRSASPVSPTAPPRSGYHLPCPL